MADVEALVAALTIDEKVALVAGEDLWSTVGVDRLGIPKLRLTDGPSGARGAEPPGGAGEPSTCTPCGSAMGATWDPDLAERIGALVGREALDRGCRALLAPTVNLHRAVLAGRNFECYSEDPLLSGKLAAGFVRGVQASGVIATVKHFVGNEQEHERSTISADIDDRALRELYLLPFELAVREGGALGIMTSYNRLNGRWLTQQPALLLDVLRGEWGFQGLVMTDWFAFVDTLVSTGAGVDLEMPGPARAFGEALLLAVKSGEVASVELDDAVRRQLGAWNRIGALDASTAPIAPRPPRLDDLELVRRAAIDSIVLLRNDGTLPLDLTGIGTLALIGPNADMPRIMGGGSSEVAVRGVRTPLEEVRERLGDGIAVVHERGCDIEGGVRPIGNPGLRAPVGFDVEFFEGLELSGPPIRRRTVETLRILEFPDGGLPAEWSLRATGQVVPGFTGTLTLGLAQSGRARVFVNGELVLDGFTEPPPPGGTEFFGFLSQDLQTEIDVEVGAPLDVTVEYAAIEAMLAGVRVGFALVDDADALLERAVAAAAAADVSVVVIGTSSDCESESFDRRSFALPGRQDELVRRVAAVNPRTVVVVNAGSVVELPWADDVAAVLQCWFGGQELAGALVAVLTGEEEPGGRLATTIPSAVEHSPSWDNFPGENGHVRYGESVFVGYRGHEHRRIEPRFSFGHGLGYTTFEIGPPELSSPSFQPGGTLTVSVPVTNTGRRSGSEVVQLYVAPGRARLVRPPKELKAFAKVRLDAGASATVALVLDDRSFAYWDPGQHDWEDVHARVAGVSFIETNPLEERRPPGWQVDAGAYDLLIGRSSVDIAHRVTLQVS